MPRPKYIICSQNRLVDKFSGLVSHINVLEELHGSSSPVAATQVDAPGSRLMSLSLIAVWRRGDDDSDDEVFEVDARMRAPGEGEAKTLFVGEFMFDQAYHYRIDIQINQIPAMSSGDLVFDSRLRKKGAMEWIGQSYEIKVSMENAQK